MEGAAEKPKGFARQIADLRHQIAEAVARADQSAKIAGDALIEARSWKDHASKLERERDAHRGRADTLELRLQRALGYLDRITEGETVLVEEQPQYQPVPRARRRGPSLNAVGSYDDVPF
jgi:hypothetical protein